MRRTKTYWPATAVLLGCVRLVPAADPVPARDGPDLWKLAQQHAATLRFSTLFTAQDVGHGLSRPGGTEQAIRWCQETGVTHVYVESFRGGYTVDKAVLLDVKKAFQDAGLLVSGCVTTTNIGRKSVNGWEFPCFSDPAGREKLKSVFEFTAGVFDEIMIDDFFATKCECDQCVKARGARSWSEYRLELLADVSRHDVLEPARRVNPGVKIILKYPQWYDQFHERGYDVAVQPGMFDTIWVGTETREPDSQQWGRKSQYEAYFIMRWLGAIGGAKCAGGWFDPYGTKPATYVEQARQTILGGGHEAVLFCYGSLTRDNGPENVAALRAEMPKLFALAELIKGLPPRGIAAPKPANSPADGNEYVYDFVGLLGLPLAPAAQLQTDVPAAFLSYQVSKDPQWAEKLKKMVAAGTPVLITRQLKEYPGADVPGDHLLVLDVPKDPWELMRMPAERLAEIRQSLLKPLGVEWDGPARVALYLFADNLVVVENFNDTPVDAHLLLRGAAKPKIALCISANEPNTIDAAGGALHIGKRSLLAVKFGE